MAPLDDNESQSLAARPLRRVDVLGVGISAVNLQRAVEEVQRWILDNEQHYVCVTGVHGVMESQRDNDLLRMHNHSGLTVADGLPMLWAGRYAGTAEMGRVRGPDLLPALCALAAEKGWSNYFYGGAPGTTEALIERLQGRFAGLRVVGSHCPPFRPLTSDEDDAVVAEINTCAPDLLWVGLSTPKQERWMSDHLGRVCAPALLGVGAAFDVHAGLIRQAPLWIQRSGFEWLYRTATEPRRLGRRYLRNNPRFLQAIVRQRPFVQRHEGR